MNKKIIKLINLSDSLDYSGLHKYSSEVDLLIKKMANPTPSVIPGQPQAIGFDPFRSLEYMKGLDSMFRNLRQNEDYEQRGVEIGTYQELQEAKKQRAAMYSQDSPEGIVRSVIQKTLRELFDKLTCMTDRQDRGSLNKGGKYVFRSEVELMDDIFMFTSPIVQVSDTITKNDGTIKKCLDGFFYEKKDLEDPRFKAAYQKYKEEAMESLEDPSIFNAGKQYKLSEIILVLKN
jgi:hypothetical protein